MLCCAACPERAQRSAAIYRASRRPSSSSWRRHQVATCSRKSCFSSPLFACPIKIHPHKNLGVVHKFFMRTTSKTLLRGNTPLSSLMQIIMLCPCGVTARVRSHVFPVHCHHHLRHLKSTLSAAHARRALMMNVRSRVPCCRAMALTPRQEGWPGRGNRSMLCVSPLYAGYASLTRFCRVVSRCETDAYISQPTFAFFFSPSGADATPASPGGCASLFSSTLATTQLPIQFVSVSKVFPSNRR